MADPMAQHHHSSLNAAIQNEMNRKAFKMGTAAAAADYHQLQQAPGFTPMGISRERSFVRMSNHGHNQQNAAKRRSLAFSHPHQAQQMRGAKPALELYRPPNYFADSRLDVQNKLNVHAQEFQMARGDHLQNSRSSMAIFQGNHHQQAGSMLQHSKSHGSMHHQMQMIAARQLQLANLKNANTHLVNTLTSNNRSSMVGSGGPPQGPQTHQPSPTTARVKFAPDTASSPPSELFANPRAHMTASLQQQQQQLQQRESTPLQRSKSLSSAADAIARGIAGLGLGVASETAEIGTFIPEIQALIDQANVDPNQLNARSLMELANHIMQRAVEGRRYALPTSRFCISIMAKEQKETFLEALLNTCRQWYQERDKVLGTPQSIKNSSRPRFTAFMAFLTEMFCQLKRRQLQLRTKCDGEPPALVLLTLLARCCEDCVQPPVRSLSEIECLFFVLTCIGRDLEQQLPQQLDSLLAAVRDAFLNASASAPAIRRTLLQLIELQASRWQLPGNTVLYYYPSSK